MEHMELIEQLREKSGCSYTEAKAALESTNNDLLEALCWLEQHGKTQLSGTSYSTQEQQSSHTEQAPQADSAPKEDGPFAHGCKSLWEGLKDLLSKCNHTEIIMTGKSGKRELSMPLTLLLLLVLINIWVMLALAVVALFFGFRFSLNGTLSREDVNEALDNATDFAESIKDEFRTRHKQEGEQPK